MKLHNGDTVIVISGKDKGKTGSIIRVLAEEGRVIVSGINMRTRHVKKTYQQAGQIIRYEASLSSSNVMVVDPKTKKPSRIGYKIDEKGKKIRIAKASGAEVVKVKAPKVAKGKKEDDKKEEALAAPTAAPSKKPFWKRTFGGASDGAEGGSTKPDHSVPGQGIPRKSAGRGS